MRAHSFLGGSRKLLLQPSSNRSLRYCRAKPGKMCSRLAGYRSARRPHFGTAPGPALAQRCALVRPCATPATKYPTRPNPTNCHVNLWTMTQPDPYPIEPLYISNNNWPAIRIMHQTAKRICLSILDSLQSCIILRGIQTHDPTRSTITNISDLDPTRPDPTQTNQPYPRVNPTHGRLCWYGARILSQRPGPH